MSAGSPGIEYEKVGLLMGNIFSVMRLSMGDFGCITAADYLKPFENYVFWMIFLLNAVITCIIFLNFIVAEAGNTYNIVSEEIDNYIQQQKADLVAEAESLIPAGFKN